MTVAGSKKSDNDYQKTHQSEPSTEHGLGPSVSHFSRLSHEIIDNLHYLEALPLGADPDTLQAASDFSDALRSKRASVSSGFSCNGANTVHPEIPPHCEGKHHLPSLPPILDEVLEKSTFTHPATSNNIEATYDRLEVLGDAYIELIATRFIWSRYQGISSGHISQIRELLVKNETLAEYATHYGLDNRAIVPQDYSGQPKRWIKTKADIFEAYVAAVILSDTTSGYSTAETWLTRLWLPKLSDLKIQPPVLHAKEDLAKKIMGKHVKLKYIDEQPPIEHGKGKQTFFIGVYLTGWGWDNMHMGSGQGSSKAAAGDEAARKALENDQLLKEIISIKKGAMSKRSRE
ncbi:hypothetical protein FE257_005803 [Aspergillus nanangensis]|uniref:RNase III domain-containing protein n=1 Tax=Aspergillus nanangensis TaxID=2582783 RepID=A0AAD4CBA9_ASPNN|nr:hypothetical protein FE257_005803 [Aspergillus nanangensis]